MMLFRKITLLLIALFLIPVACTKSEKTLTTMTAFTSIPVLEYSNKNKWISTDILPGCKAVLKDLQFVKIQYWGFDNATHTGGLIVHKELAPEIIDIFKILYQAKYPIEKVDGELKKGQIDPAASNENLTIAYNCREVTGQPGYLSQHSYGRAIDINPVINPYVKGKLVIPSGGERFISRDIPHAAKITKDSLIYRLFIERGWDWGGSWFDLQDYQHFEKRANGEKRDPYGYPRKKDLYRIRDFDSRH